MSDELQPVPPIPSPPEGEGRTATTKRTIEGLWQVPAGPGFHKTVLRRWSPDGTVEIVSEDNLIVAELSPSDARLTGEWLGRPVGAVGLASDWRPPEQLIEFVAWKLRIAIDSFYGRVLLLVAHADRANLHALRQAFPAIVEAWEAWQKSDGDFELTPTVRRFVEGGDVR